LKVPVLTLGTATFGEKDNFFNTFKATDAAAATRLVDVCLEMGMNLFDSADIYTGGRSEQILGEAIKGRRQQVMISTKATFSTGPGPNEIGSSRFHLIRSVEQSLRRLQTDYIDLFQLHGFDAQTPVEETVRALDDMVKAGKILYTGCSNFSGWHLMKSLAVSERYGWTRYVAHQAYYSLVGREYEWELMPLAVDQNVGTVVWSPLGWGRLTGRIRRGQALPEDSRLRSQKAFEKGPQVPEERLFRVTDALEVVSKQTGKTIPQIALNWLLGRPTVASLIIGAHTEEQLRENIAATGWALAPEHAALLDEASQEPKVYPYWHQNGFSRNPAPVA
jgi:aryl-alcohol dehydrogenase-like predicted oxidoreductase